MIGEVLIAFILWLGVTYLAIKIQSWFERKK